MAKILTRQKIAIEDMLVGHEGKEVVQVRAGKNVTVREIGASTIPFNDTETVAEAVERLEANGLVGNKLGLQDLLVGVSNDPITESRAGADIQLNNLNASVLPYTASKSIKEALDDLAGGNAATDANSANIATNTSDINANKVDIVENQTAINEIKSDITGINLSVSSADNKIQSIEGKIEPDNKYIIRNTNDRYTIPDRSIDNKKVNLNSVLQIFEEHDFDNVSTVDNTLAKNQILSFNINLSNTNNLSLQILFGNDVSQAIILDSHILRLTTAGNDIAYFIQNAPGNISNIIIDSNPWIIATLEGILVTENINETSFASGVADFQTVKIAICNELAAFDLTALYKSISDLDSSVNSKIADNATNIAENTAKIDAIDVDFTLPEKYVFKNGVEGLALLGVDAEYGVEDVTGTSDSGTISSTFNSVKVVQNQGLLMTGFVPNYKEHRLTDLNIDALNVGFNVYGEFRSFLGNSSTHCVAYLGNNLNHVFGDRNLYYSITKYELRVKHSGNFTFEGEPDSVFNLLELGMDLSQTAEFGMQVTHVEGTGFTAAVGYADFYGTKTSTNIADIQYKKDDVTIEDTGLLTPIVSDGRVVLDFTYFATDATSSAYRKITLPNQIAVGKGIIVYAYIKREIDLTYPSPMSIHSSHTLSSNSIQPYHVSFEPSGIYNKSQNNLDNSLIKQTEASDVTEFKKCVLYVFRTATDEYKCRSVFDDSYSSEVTDNVSNLEYILFGISNAPHLASHQWDGHMHTIGYIDIDAQYTGLELLKFEPEDVHDPDKTRLKFLLKQNGKSVSSDHTILNLNINDFYNLRMGGTGAAGQNIYGYEKYGIEKIRNTSDNTVLVDKSLTDLYEKVPTDIEFSPMVSNNYSFGRTYTGRVPQVKDIVALDGNSISIWNGKSKPYLVVQKDGALYTVKELNGAIHKDEFAANAFGVEQSGFVAGYVYALQPIGDFHVITRLPSLAHLSEGTTWYLGEAIDANYIDCKPNLFSSHGTTEYVNSLGQISRNHMESNFLYSAKILHGYYVMTRLNTTDGTSTVKLLDYWQKFDRDVSVTAIPQANLVFAGNYKSNEQDILDSVTAAFVTS